MRIFLGTFEKPLTGYRWVSHVSVPTDINVNSVVNGFETVTRASAIPDCVVTEGGPGMNT